MSLSVNGSNNNNPLAICSRCRSRAPRQAEARSRDASPIRCRSCWRRSGSDRCTGLASGGASSSSTHDQGTTGSTSPQFGPQTLQALFAMQANASQSSASQADGGSAADVRPIQHSTQQAQHGHHHHGAGGKDSASDLFASAESATSQTVGQYQRLFDHHHHLCRRLVRVADDGARRRTAAVQRRLRAHSRRFRGVGQQSARAIDPDAGAIAEHHYAAKHHDGLNRRLKPALDLIPHRRDTAAIAAGPDRLPRRFAWRASIPSCLEPALSALRSPCISPSAASRLRWSIAAGRARARPTAIPASSKAIRFSRRCSRRASARCCASRSSSRRKRIITGRSCRRSRPGCWRFAPRRSRSGSLKPRKRCGRCSPARSPSMKRSAPKPARPVICVITAG